MIRFNAINKKLAFTLAEVLITLGIIGIVAEMTIPTLVSSTAKQVELSQFKKFYSSFAQGMQSYMANEEMSDLASTGIFNPEPPDTDWDTNLDSKMKEIFKIAKSCNWGDEDCGHYLKNIDNTVYVNTSFNPFAFSGHCFITQDGVLFNVTPQAGNCDLWSTFNTTSRAKNACGFMYLDVNADKPPNQWGRDAFFMVIGNDGVLYPTGGPEMAKISANSDNYSANAAYWRNNTACGTSGSSVIASGSSGTNCGARIIEEGWQMKY